MKTNTAQLALALVRHYQTPPYRCTGKPGLHHGAEETCTQCAPAPEPFALTHDDIGGGWLCSYAPEVVTMQALRAAFGKADEGYFDEEKGYDGIEYRFRALDGSALRLYTRCGSWRVGGTDEALAESFLVWLTGKLGR